MSVFVHSTNMAGVNSTALGMALTSTLRRHTAQKPLNY